MQMQCYYHCETKPKKIYYISKFDEYNSYNSNGLSEQYEKIVLKGKMEFFPIVCNSVLYTPFIPKLEIICKTTIYNFFFQI